MFFGPKSAVAAAASTSMPSAHLETAPFRVSIFAYRSLYFRGTISSVRLFPWYKLLAFFGPKSAVAAAASNSMPSAHLKPHAFASASSPIGPFIFAHRSVYFRGTNCSCFFGTKSAVTAAASNSMPSAHLKPHRFASASSQTARFHASIFAHRSVYFCDAYK